MTPPDRIIAGAMSGTSADGVDVALTRIQGRGTSMTAQLIHHHHRAYDPATRAEIFAFRGGDAIVNLSRLAQLGRTISLTYATAVNEALAVSRHSATDLAAVAAHGQTLYHDPPNTIQWFDPALLAAEVGCPVVSDFRRADLAAGGQGAPLVPYADYILFRHPMKNRILLNIGGIANLTYVPAGGSIDELIAFDTGPGNCISDFLMRTRTEFSFDEGGHRALSGKRYIPLADKMVYDDVTYFRKPPPKSTDTPSMIQAYLDARMTLPSWQTVISLDDELATACWITAGTIIDAVEQLLPTCRGWKGWDEMIVSGGGVHNELVMQLLKERSAFEEKTSPMTTDDLGIPSQAKEALAFALLAAATLDGEPSNVPSVTGARRAVVLGSITPKP